MITGNEPAFAELEQHLDASISYNISLFKTNSGLNIRQYFAAKAMAGMLSAGDHDHLDFAIIAIESVRGADALIKALNEEEVK